MNWLKTSARFRRSLAALAIAISGGVATWSYADASADIALLRTRANLLDEAAQGCQSSENPPKCKVSVTWEGGRQISASAAMAYAQTLRAKAAELETLAEAEALSTPAVTAPQIDSNSFGAPGTWSSSETQIVRQTFGRFGRGPLFDFIRANVRFSRRNLTPGGSMAVGSSDMIGESDGMVYFYDAFFWPQIRIGQDRFLNGDALDVRRTNLMAFESGKAIYGIIKDRPLPDGQRFADWFQDYAGANESRILAIKAAAYKRGGGQENLVNVTSDLPGTEPESAFGYLFRGTVLNLEKPKAKSARDQYDATISDFQARLNWALTHR